MDTQLEAVLAIKDPSKRRVALADHYYNFPDSPSNTRNRTKNPRQTKSKRASKRKKKTTKRQKVSNKPQVVPNIAEKENIEVHEGKNEEEKSHESSVDDDKSSGHLMWEGLEDDDLPDQAIGRRTLPLPGADEVPESVQDELFFLE